MPAEQHVYPSQSAQTRGRDPWPVYHTIRFKIVPNTRAPRCPAGPAGTVPTGQASMAKDIRDVLVVVHALRDDLGVAVYAVDGGGQRCLKIVFRWTHTQPEQCPHDTSYNTVR